MLVVISHMLIGIEMMLYRIFFEETYCPSRIGMNLSLGRVYICSHLFIWTTISGSFILFYLHFAAFYFKYVIMYTCPTMLIIGHKTVDSILAWWSTMDGNTPTRTSSLLPLQHRHLCHHQHFRHWGSSTTSPLTATPYTQGKNKVSHPWKTQKSNKPMLEHHGFKR